jgi:hypothetical protein
VDIAKGMLFVVLARRAGADWSWHNDRTGNRTEIIPSYCLDEFVRKIAKDTSGSMVVRWWPLHYMVDFPG